MPAILGASAWGSRSAIQTKRLSPDSGNTWAEALWWVIAPPTTDQTSRRAWSSRSTISSRATMPLPKVTTRAPSSSRTSVTKPGASLRWTAPTSRSAAHASSGSVSIQISRWMDATIVLLRGEPGAEARRSLGESCGGATPARLSASLLDEVPEARERLVPALGDLIEIAARRVEPRRVEVEDPLPTAAYVAHEPGSGEDAEVLGDGLSRDGGATREPCDRLGAARAQARHEREPRLVAERRKD